MISYCICVYRPRLFYILAEDLVRKTTAAYEILVWINCRAPDIEAYVRRMSMRGIPIRIVGASPPNVGMVGYKMLFANARYNMIAQVHDDVVCVSRGIAERADKIFKTHPKVRQIVADVIQDGFTTGGRPGKDAYQDYDKEHGLLNGPVDGWFGIYHRSILNLLNEAPYEPYFYLGSYIQMKLAAEGKESVLCSKMKVFHLAGPAYAQLFDTVEIEVRKFMALGKKDSANAYANMKPSPDVLDQMYQQYTKNIEHLEIF